MSETTAEERAKRRAFWATITPHDPPLMNDFERRLLDERDALELEKNNAYEERERCVALIAALALARGWEAGMARTAIEGWDEEWHGLTLIDLPTGQVSWHMHGSHAPFFEGLPQYSGVWDGHDTKEKYRRVDELAKRIFAAHTATAGEVEG